MRKIRLLVMIASTTKMPTPIAIQCHNSMILSNMEFGGAGESRTPKPTSVDQTVFKTVQFAITVATPICYYAPGVGVEPTVSFDDTLTACSITILDTPESLSNTPVRHRPATFMESLNCDS